MSFHQSTGLSIIIEDPLVKSTRGLSMRLTEQVDRYKHEIRAIGGYYSAKISISDRQDKIEDWIERGLARHVKVLNPELETIFEGFVNQLSANLGPLSYEAGPILSLGNRVKAVYSTVDNSVTPPVVGIREETDVANNTESQDRYGIIEKVLSLSGADETLADQVRDTFLADPSKAFPPVSRKSTLSGTRASQISLDILGYWHWLEAYIYNSTTTGDQDIDAKIQAVLAAEPNGTIFSSDTSRITANTAQVPAWEDNNSKAMAIMKSLNSLGDASQNRYNIGFYADRVLQYEVAPSSITFQQRIAGNRGITNQIDGTVQPWNVTPAEWLFYPDFLAGRLPPVTLANLREDPRAGYIETVKFTAPNTLSIDGKTLGPTDQLMACVGIGGFGA